MANKVEYLLHLQVAIQHLHKCGATWRDTVPVHEVSQGKTEWKGDVEVFDLHNHPKAERCYAWGHLHGENGERTRLVAVLEIRPVKDAVTAVRVQIVKDATEKK